MNDKFKDGPLTGVKVLDLTTVVMGPYGARILADLGADVIKIEAPGGDLMREYRPYRHEGMSGQVLHLHRNKRSIVLDLKLPAAMAALKRLIAKSDVFMHNMRPKAIKRLGLDYPEVRKLNANLIYCGAYGFGTGGPYEDKAAYDDLIQAACGLAELAARFNDQPAYVPTTLFDKLTSQTIAYSIIAALYKRTNGGGGQEIEVPMFETAIEFMMNEHICGGAFEPALGKMGYARLLTRSRKPFRTADGYVGMMPYTNKNWDDFFDFVGAPELKGDARFDTFDNRVAHTDILYGLIEREAAKRTTAQWLAFCDNASIPCMRVNSLDEIPDDPHVRSVGLIAIEQHPTEGKYRYVRSSVKFDRAPLKLRRHAPTLGQNSVEVLAEYGLSDDEIAQALGGQRSDQA